MYVLRDTFNDRDLSQHRTLENAIKAQIRHARAVKRANGSNAYLTYEIATPDGRTVNQYDDDVFDLYVKHGW